MTPLFLHRFDKTAGELAVDVLVAFCAAPQLDARVLADEVEAEIDRRLAPDELIILVRESAFEAAATAMTDTTQGVALSGRLAARCRMRLVGYDAGGKMSREQILTLGGLESGVELEEIVRRGVTAIFATRGGFVQASPSYHFANPSGAHTDRFIRVSNILARHAEIALLALAIMPHLPADARVTYIDTPALFAVVAAINEQLRTLDPKRPALFADSFGSYFGLEAIGFVEVDKSVVLISASSSGRLAGKLVDRHGLDPARIIHVLFLGPDSPGRHVAVDLGCDTEANPDGFSTERRTFDAHDCALCRQGSTPLALKGDQFDIAGPQHPPILIKKADASKGLANAMARLSGTGALRVSLGPKLYNVAPIKLLESKDYTLRLEYLFRRQIPGQVAAVVLADDEAEPLLDRARTIVPDLPAPVERAGVPALGSTASTLPVGAILVLASVIGSGRALLDISRDLRNVAPDAPIIYIVGFAKSSDPVRALAFERSLIQSGAAVPHVFERADELLLPATSMGNPWVEELRFPQRNISAADGHGATVLRQRIHRLNGASTPLTSDLFLPDHAGAPLPLREGFVFWPPSLPKKKHSQADVFYTISSVLQQLRTVDATAGEQAIRDNWMQQTLLSPENFGRFNDGIIQASLLRAARSPELDYRDDADASSEAALMIRRVLESASRPRGEAAAEFLLAIGTGRLKLCRRDHDTVISDIPDAPELVKALAAMCRFEIARPATPTTPPRKRARVARKA